MTGFYMSRMWFMTFAGEPKSDVVDHVHESTPWIKEPLIILTVITAIGGFALALLGYRSFPINADNHLYDAWTFLANIMIRACIFP